jgi:hypothetical protein
VVEAVLEGVTDLAELRRHGRQTWLTDEQVAPFVDEISAELAHARQVLEDTMPASKNVEAADWEAFQRDTPSLPDTDWEIARELVFERICQRRAAEREAAERARAACVPAAAVLAGLSARSMLTGSESLRISPGLFAAGASPTDWRATVARRRDELVATRARARQQAEDLEGEVQRLRRPVTRSCAPRVSGGALGSWATSPWSAWWCRSCS